MTESCPICNTPRRSGYAFCEKCGHRFQDRRCPRCNNIIDPMSSFCRQCGYKIIDAASGSTSSTGMNPPQAGPAAQPFQPTGYNTESTVKKSNKALKFILIGAVIIAVLVAAFFLTRPLWDKSAQQAYVPSQQSTVNKKPASPPVCSYDSPSVIRPALYQSTDYLVYFKGSSEEDKDVILTVEIPQFTQKYEQKLTLKPQETRLKIKPPMIDGVLKTLNIQRQAQIKVSVQDAATQKYIIQDTKNVQLLSKNDMKWESDDGSETYYENICAWVTPESPKIEELLRNSVDQLSIWTNGSINEIVGYQMIGDLTPEQISYYQVAAMYETMRNYYNVRYTMKPISTSGKEAQQRIALPEEVLNQKSGICIETAVTLASAIEATGMHPMILILPGHAQVAFETWQDSGQYYLVETTALTEPDWNNIIMYLDQDQWSQYLSENQVTVVDVQLARKDGIKPME